MSLKKKIFISINCILQIVFLSFIVYGFSIKDYRLVISLTSSSMLVFISSMDILDDIK